MKAEVSGRLRWMMVVLIGTGCAGKPCGTVQVSPPASLLPLIFYDETGNPCDKTPALSEIELQSIVDWTATRTKDPIWMIRVKPSFPGGRRAGVFVYLAPTKVSSRIREGYAYNVAVFKSEINPPSPWRYVQVSVPGHMYDGSLDKPSIPEMPFDWPVVIDSGSKEPSPMSVDEMTRIVDFLRQPASYDDPVTRRALPDRAAGKRPYDLPICRIRREGGTVRVVAGFQHGGLWAWGWFITLECIPTGYRMTECAMWMS